jgi:flavin reductase (DIM6/NTAB) family NADH-FMN oxidoreductase RutF
VTATSRPWLLRSTARTGDRGPATTPALLYPCAATGLGHDHNLTATRIDSETFQEVMANLPAGVAVVTALDSTGKARGLTTTAVTSVSLDPPLLLVCVDRYSRTLPAIRHSGSFAVNLLAAAHAPVARLFASKVEDKFAEIAWAPGKNDSPILHHHSVAWAECRTRQEIDAGDHVVFIGEVTHGGVSVDARMSLVYFRRSFGRWATLET